MKNKYRSLENIIRDVVIEASAIGYSRPKGNISGTDKSSHTHAGDHSGNVSALAKTSNARVNARDAAAVDKANDSKEKLEHEIKNRQTKAAERSSKGKIHTEETEIEEDKDVEGVSIGTKKRREVENVSRQDSPEPTSEKSELGKNAEIKTKIKEDQTMFKKNFGLPSALIDAARIVMEKKNDKTHSGDPKKIMGGKSGVEIDPELKQEKMSEELSPKQKKIAAVAGNPKKIDAADFKALRATKESVEFTEEELARLDKIAATFAESTMGSDDGVAGKTNFSGTGPTTSGYLQEKVCKKCGKNPCVCIKEEKDDKLTTKNTQEQPDRTGEMKKIIKGTTEKIVGEETVLDEARGRPRKSGESAEGDDTAKHPIQQLEKISHAIEGNEPHFEHKDGSKTKLNKHQAGRVMNIYRSLKTTQEKDDFGKKVHASPASMRSAVNG